MVKTVLAAGLASAMSAFPNSTVAEPDYSSAPKQFQSFYELYKQNYVINEYIGLANASSVMTDMTNDFVCSTLKANLIATRC